MAQKLHFEILRSNQCIFCRNILSETLSAIKAPRLFVGGDILEQLFGVGFCFDVLAGENGPHYAFFVYEECGAYDSDGGFAVHFLLSPCSELLQQG